MPNSELAIKAVAFSVEPVKDRRETPAFFSLSKNKIIKENPSILTGQDTVHPSCRKETEIEHPSICIMCSMQKRADRILPDRRQSAAIDTAVMRRDGSSELWSPSSARLLHPRELTSMPSMNHSSTAPSVSRDLRRNIRDIDLCYRMNAGLQLWVSPVVPVTPCAGFSAADMNGRRECRPDL